MNSDETSGSDHPRGPVSRRAAKPATVPKIRQVMSELGRVPFLPESQHRFADADVPLPIGYGQTNSQPSTVAAMIELLEVVPGTRILDIGCGSGWTTAILARLTGESGEVIGVERIPEITRRARAAVAAQGMGWAEVRQAVPGVFGLPEDEPFDRILVSAAADTLPTELLDQLAPGGILVIPVGTHMRRLRKRPDGQVEDTRHGLYTFVPLIRDEAKDRGRDPI
ncbi:fibrillarin-like rRNA methylase [Brevibacterium daeguense]|uniref:Protein-L-isoaspartate O-methyltransferase n=1 Tax=Brevibacterium daeguense TaxID=909936 RepID=A0ABP8EJH9_9MICO